MYIQIKSARVVILLVFLSTIYSIHSASIKKTLENPSESSVVIRPKRNVQIAYKLLNGSKTIFAGIQPSIFFNALHIDKLFKKIFNTLISDDQKSADAATNELKKTVNRDKVKHGQIFSQRLIPMFAFEKLFERSQPLMRKKRAVSTILPYIGKIFGWSAAIVDNSSKTQINQTSTIPMVRKKRTASAILPHIGKIFGWSAAIVENSLKTTTNQTLVRKARALPAAFLPAIGKFAGWTAAMAIAGIATTAADVAIRDMVAKDNEARLARQTIDCDLNHFGCIQGLCWTNCGPRLSAADWCFTTKNDSVNNPELVSCKFDRECDSCWSCGTACILEGASLDKNGVISRKQVRN